MHLRDQGQQFGHGAVAGNGGVPHVISEIDVLLEPPPRIPVQPVNRAFAEQFRCLGWAHRRQSTDPSSDTAPPRLLCGSAEHTAPAMTVLSADTTTLDRTTSTHASRSVGPQVVEGRPSTRSHQSASGLGSVQMIGSSGRGEDVLGSSPSDSRSGSASAKDRRTPPPHRPVATVGDRSGRVACRSGCGSAGGDGMRRGWTSLSSTNVCSFAACIGHRSCGVGGSASRGGPPTSLSMPSQLYPTRPALSAKRHTLGADLSCADRVRRLAGSTAGADCARRGRYRARYLTSDVNRTVEVYASGRGPRNAVAPIHLRLLVDGRSCGPVLAPGFRPWSRFTVNPNSRLQCRQGCRRRSRLPVSRLQSFRPTIAVARNQLPEHLYHRSCYDFVVRLCAAE